MRLNKDNLRRARFEPMPSGNVPAFQPQIKINYEVKFVSKYMIYDDKTPKHNICIVNELQWDPMLWLTWLYCCYQNRTRWYLNTYDTVRQEAVLTIEKMVLTQRITQFMHLFTQLTTCKWTSVCNV